MAPNTICKTVHQYNKFPLPEEDMEKLLEIAEDYRRVKNYVYQRYGGPASLSKLYPGYTIQNEMTESGLRGRLELPSVYFYLAVFDALGDIKTQWTRIKSIVSKAVGQNENFSEEEKHYLRFLLKIGQAFDGALNHQAIQLQGDTKKQYEELARDINVNKLHNYLCRQVRKHLTKLHTSRAEGFSIGSKAYRYGEHGIYIAIKEKRKRIFIPLTDNNHYQSQLYIKLYPEGQGIEIHVPIQITVREHPDYIHERGISLGMQIMLTTDQGHEYGQELGQRHMDYVEWIQDQMRSYHQNRENNPGRKKHNRKKKQYEARLHSYINQELNRFLRTEKPRIVYLPKLPVPRANGLSKKVNHSVTLWQRGYIRERLALKCREQSVEIREVFGKGISNTCSRCGEVRQKDADTAATTFFCRSCGLQLPDRVNAARNAKERGQKEKK